ncbi:hypothetical protein DPMN_145558, partial [Dreissena polymorpha]
DFLLQDSSDFIKINILTKFHKDWMKTINILIKFYKDWMNTVTSIAYVTQPEKSLTTMGIEPGTSRFQNRQTFYRVAIKASSYSKAINILTKFHNDWMKTVTSPVYTSKLLTDAHTHIRTPDITRSHKLTISLLDR